MSSQFEPSSPSPGARSRRRRMGWTIRITPAGIIILLLINLVILAGWAYGISRAMAGPGFLSKLLPGSPSETSTETIVTSLPPTGTATIQPSATSTNPPADTPTPNPVTPSPQPIGTLTLNQGLIVMALAEGGYTHLYIYQPQEVSAGQPVPLRRITHGPWDDIHPAISPDGKSIAFVSNRSGYWDIYRMDLAGGAITRMTDTLVYEGAPTWSPDNQWLAYEVYAEDNLEIRIQSMSPGGETILLTDHPAADFSPAWSPLGRQIAFVSNRSGENEIWLADLDNTEDERYIIISNNPGGMDTHPAWSPDGAYLAWVSEQSGIRSLALREMQAGGDEDGAPTGAHPRSLGSGDWPIWSADGETVLTILEAPNQNYLTAYRVNHPGLVLPALVLPGAVHGLSWGTVAQAAAIELTFQQAAQITPTALYTTELANPPEQNGGRYQLSRLAGVEAPHPYLHDLTDESFQALRARVSYEAGWDFLSSLENAYVPLTTPLEPGMGNDWLYTGRGIALNTAPMSAGWMVVVLEEFGPEAYWRVYIRSLHQDGSAGMPLHDMPWDFYSRTNGDTQYYELGGAKYGSIPLGYWIDFTELALSYGWERLPALTTWRASYPAARYNEFAWIDSLNWHSAMLELYPPESMITPSPVAPPTRTPTPTSRWYVSPTPTTTPTPRPTFTPYQVPVADTPTPGG